jgi:hypothetical protein
VLLLFGRITGCRVCNSSAAIGLWPIKNSSASPARCVHYNNNPSASPLVQNPSGQCCLGGIALIAHRSERSLTGPGVNAPIAHRPDLPVRQHVGFSDTDRVTAGAATYGLPRPQLVWRYQLAPNQTNQRLCVTLRA